MGNVDLSRYRNALAKVDPIKRSGRVAQVVSLTIEATGLDCEVGEVCEIEANGSGPLLAEVVGFRNERVLLMPLGDMQGLKPGSAVHPQNTFLRAPVGMELLGRVVDGLGNPIDDLGPVNTKSTRTIYNYAPHPLQRKSISEPLITGVRAIDGMITCGKGQRIGIFAGSGVGKSTMMGSIARNALSHVSVVALIGERGREVREFVENDLGPEGLARSVVVVSTSDQPALVRLKAAWVAMTMAEYYREQGMHVTFLMDSVTRFAMAQREVGLAVGEPPASKGYTPSVFALLPKLLERAGMAESGSITGFFTVLVEGDDFNEPISDASRSILDGHIMLTRELAQRNHYPAIDVLQSISRVMPAITNPEHREYAGHIRRLLASYEKARDLINIGAYVEGSDLEIDTAIEAMPYINTLLQQGQDDSTKLQDTTKFMQMISEGGYAEDGH
ncbi:MAG: FliI/YscN family ATPase [Chloroflexi bacterium]|nr:MAG: FliI/YscN family ATPase [Chloroflexota bacterium]MBL1194840.1 FliI/YscN family ATPase [Chloroflexota bacterium]NOH12131.1 FliI/YscN family ATPase [Chloroflexota bacterium]